MTVIKIIKKHVLQSIKPVPTWKKWFCWKI